MHKHACAWLFDRMFIVVVSVVVVKCVVLKKYPGYGYFVHLHSSS